MSEFKYINNELYCEGVKVSKIAKDIGTPCYIYSHKYLIDQFNQIKKAFSKVDPLICFAMKANDNLAVVKTLVDQGAGCDIVSVGELKIALKAGVDPKKIVYASTGKTEYEIIESIKAGILFFNVESLPELEEINRIAGKMRRKAAAALRINPDVKAVTHDKITTGTLDKKFGLDLATARRILKNRVKYPNVDIKGLHMHIGSQILESKPYEIALKKVIAFLDELTMDGIFLEYMDMGGGIGIPYNNEDVESMKAFAAKLLPLLEKTGLKIVMEPGRYICGNAGILATRTIYVKDNGIKKFIIVDAGMNDLIRPTMYEAYHEIIPVVKSSRKKMTFDVVGPICESGDVFGKRRNMASVDKGDLLAIMSAGAYSHVMSSNYNMRCRPAEVMVKGNKYAVVKERETFKDLMKGEQIPGFLK
jgi:diaminopimelate decarboxylase